MNPQHRLFAFFCFLSLLIQVPAFGQVLINPAGNGGFEIGGTFAANGWTEVNTPPAQTNQWYAGTAATGFTGARCAFVGTASNNNNYNINIGSVVHFYRDIVFPAGQPIINLSFSWKGYGESIYDYIRVYLVPTGTAVTAGTQLFTGQLGATYYNQSSAWQTANINIPCTAAGTTQRLVFSWINDFSLGTMPAGAIDNISVVSSPAGSCNVMMGAGVINVPSLPYNSGPGSTCGQGNDLTALNTAVCGSNIYLTGEDQVFVFTPAATGTVTISLNAPSASFTGLMLYSGCPVGACTPGPGSCVIFSQSSTGSKAFCANVTSGTTYYLVLDSWASPVCNAYTSLTISAVSSGSFGNTCASPVSIPALPYSVAGQNTACKGNDYTNLTPGICDGTFAFGEDLVYSFTVSGPQCIGITISGTSNNDIGFSVYQGGCPGAGGTCIGSNGGATAGALAGSVVLPAAGTYYLIIDTRSPSNNVSFNIAVSSFGAGAANDMPYQAVALPFNIPVAGNNSCSSNADEPAAAPTCFAPAGNTLNTVWYSFTAPASGCVNIRTTLGTLSNTQMAVYGPVTGAIAQGSGNTLTSMACNQDLAPCGANSYPSSQLNLTGLSPGQTYYIMVDGYASLTGSFTIYIMDAGAGCTLTLPPTPGQDCMLAFPVCQTNINVANPGPQAVGSNCEFSSGVNCLLSGERGSFWYRINIVANGFLEFSIVPNDWPGAPSTASTDYDFAVWRTRTAGTTGPATCANLATVPPVSCNYSPLGVTGCFSAANGTSPPAYPGFGGAFNQRIAVTAGDEYLLVVSNFSNSTSGFVLNFPVGSPIGSAPAPGGTLVWTGTLNTDWYNPENWGGCSAPNCMLNVSIPSTPVNQPAVTGLTAVCGSLDVSPGATLTLQANAQLKICSNFINNGTINALANSTLLLQSDSVVQNQTMSGVMTGTNRLWNLTVNKPSTAGGNTVTLNNNLDNAGNFLLCSGGAYTGGIFNAAGRHHKVAGNFTVYYTAAPFATYGNSGGILEFNGTAAQNYYNRGAVNNVVMNHTGPGVTLGNSGATDWMTITGILTLTQGRVITNLNRVNIINSAPAASTTGNTNSFVEGNLKRSFAASGGAYDFPVGTALKGYQRINFNFGGANDRSNATVSFVNTPPATPVPFLGPECVSAMYDQAPLNNGYWNVAPLPVTGVAPYTVTQYNTNYTNPQTGFTVMAKYGAGTWSLYGGCVPASTLPALQRTALSVMTNPSQFATAQSLTPLPVELIYFTATAKTSTIGLKWITASETQNSGFEIWRSSAPPEFEKIGWVEGNGTTSGENEYLFDDIQVEKNITYYYKLKQLDYNNDFRFTETVAARLTSEGFAVSAHPNPFRDQTVISVHLSKSSRVHITILSAIGQELAELENKDLEAGFYQFEFGEGNYLRGQGVYTARILIDGEATYIRLLELD